MAVEDPTSDQHVAPEAKEGGGGEPAVTTPTTGAAAAADESADSSEPVDRAKASDRSGPTAAATSESAKLPIKMLNDRILVRVEGPDGERKSTGGILIPATAQVGKRLAWAKVVGVGPTVRTMELDDRVLFNPEDRYEVEVGGVDYIILRERDIHAVAAKRLDDSHTGLYL